MDNCIKALITLTVGFLGLTVMFLGYKAKFEKKGIQLEKNDQKQEQNDKEHQERIKKLEEKNGHELEQMAKLEGKVESLEHIIKTALEKKNQKVIDKKFTTKSKNVAKT